MFQRFNILANWTGIVTGYGFRFYDWIETWLCNRRLSIVPAVLTFFLCRAINSNERHRFRRPIHAKIMRLWIYLHSTSLSPSARVFFSVTWQERSGASTNATRTDSHRNRTHKNHSNFSTFTRLTSFYGLMCLFFFSKADCLLRDQRFISVLARAFTCKMNYEGCELGLETWFKAAVGARRLLLLWISRETSRNKSEKNKKKNRDSLRWIPNL